MLGRKIDYWLLKPLSHKRNLLTEDQLNSVSESKFKINGEVNIDDELDRIKKFDSRFKNSVFKGKETKTYIDVGCGFGGLVLALAKEGAKKVVGLDIMKRRIDLARKSATSLSLGDKCVFLNQDISSYDCTEKFDVLISTEALEHIDDPGRFIKRASNLIKKNGSIVLIFGDLFHSPFGDHCNDFMKLRVPWKGVLFNEKAILQLREECFRPHDPVDRFQDIEGGLNKMRFSHFLDYVDDAGLTFKQLEINPNLKQYSLIYYLFKIFLKIPFISDYFVMSVYADLIKK
tara:strand:+ start:2100 stop:2963 length:864 start_codon:yes stop_codon:yes gene_type:complete